MKLDNLISIVVEKELGLEPTVCAVSVLDLNTGSIVECILKQYDKIVFKEELESFLDKYSNSKIIFENEDMWLTRFLKENFKDKLYRAESEIFGRRPYGWRVNKSITDTFTKTVESEICYTSLNTLKYLYKKSMSNF